MNKKFLLAAALPLFFTACNNEEFDVVSNEQQENFQEIVGEKLVGSDLTINVTRGDALSRINSTTGEFEDGDKVGLAWYSRTSAVYDEQIPDGFAWNTTSLGKNHNIYGNHKFTKSGSVFATESNVYEGFHFAYYPYSYMKQVGQIEIQPNAESQTGDYMDETLNKSFWISTQDTILATSVNEGTIEKTFVLQRAVNAIRFGLEATDIFTSGTELQKLPITKVEIQTGGIGGIFYASAKINPSKLPYAEYLDEDGNLLTSAARNEINKAKIDESIFGINATSAIQYEESAQLSFSTNVANEAFTLAEKQNIRMFLLPTEELDETIKSSELAIHVSVPCGYFRIYPQTEEASNWAAVKKLREALSTGYGETEFKLSELNYNILGIDLELNKADFNPDFSSISNITEWNYAATIANELGLENPTFTLDGEIEITDPATFVMPAEGVTVVCAENGFFSVESDFTIPAALAAGMDATDKIVVAEDATLTVADNVVLNADIDNNGTIKAAALATVGAKEEGTTKTALDNTDGRIIVEYGAYVYPANGKEGVIAYEVENAEQGTIQKINTLIATHAKGYASVNTLIVSTSLDLNASASDADDNGRYENPSLATYLSTLNNISIELVDGGAIVYTEGTNRTVKDVTCVEGKASITNIQIAEDLDVLAGELKSVNCKIGRALTNKGTLVLESELPMEITVIVNDGGTLFSNNDIKATNVTLLNKSVTTLGDDWDKTIWYNGVYVQNNSQVNGYVKNCPTSVEDLKAALESATPGSTVYLSDEISGEVTLGELKDVTIDGGGNATMTFKMDANTKIENVTLKNVAFEYDETARDCGVVINKDAKIENLVIEGCTITGTGKKAGNGIYGANTNATIVVKNCNFSNIGYGIYSTYGGGYKSLSVENCTFDNIKSWAIMPQYGFSGDLTITGCTFKNSNGGLVKTGAFTGNNFTFTNNTITNSFGHDNSDEKWFEVNASTATKAISGNTKDGSAWTPGEAQGLK